ncbi:MAG TPA: pitrilysin family protein [Myxococcaceae bacterium]|nr:pitrilysin family protein [Myxococcaceae bacterium]
MRAALAALLSLSTLALAAPVAPQKVRAVEGITEYSLPNGMRVLLFPDPSKPTVTVNATYFVGSRHEGYGEAGMAHLLEHMLFKGTPTHAEPWKELEAHGAYFNGTTSYDRTNYFETLPATPENLEWALRFEADRMVSSKVDGADLAKEFSVVRNEFEIGESDPQRVLWERMMSTAYLWHGYGRSTIGSRSDIERVPVANLKDFYRRYYQPDNAMLVVAGKFDEAKALALIGDAFGSIPRPKRALPTSYTVEPVQDGERSVTLRRTGDVAVAEVLYHGAAAADVDWPAEEAALNVLTNKPSGRLYHALVEKGLCSEVSGDVDPLTEPGVMAITCKVSPKTAPQKALEALSAAVEGLAGAKATEEEVARFRSKAARQIDLGLTSSEGIGIELTEWAAAGDWRLLFLHRDRVAALKAEDVNRVAAKFLKSSNRTSGLFLPTPAPDRAPLVTAPDAQAMVKDYTGKAAMAEGEAFTATVENLEARVERGALSSGLKLALLPKRTRGGAVKLRLVLRYGSETELKGKSAAASVMLPMLMRGTKKHGYQQLKDEFDRLKAEISFEEGGFRLSGSPGAANVYVTTIRENLPEVVALMGEVLREPVFPKAEFETLRKEQLARMEQYRQHPMVVAFTRMSQAASPYPKDDVRYVPSMDESIERLKALKLADVESLYRSLWGASAGEVVVVGDFDAAAVKAALEKALGGWKSPHPWKRIASEYRDAQVADEVIDTPDKEVAVVGAVQTLQARDDDPDYPAAVMLNHVLGGAANSRLFNRLRQKDGLSYGAFSSISADPLDRMGVFFAGAICAPQNAQKAMDAMLEEISGLAKDGVKEQELAEAKKSYAAQFNTQLADDDFVAGQLASALYVGRTLQFWKVVNDKIAQLGTADLAAAAKKYVPSAHLVKVRAADLKKAGGAAPAPAPAKP